MIEINSLTQPSLFDNDGCVKPLLPHLNPIPNPESVPNPVPTPNPKIVKRATPENYNKLIEIIKKVEEYMRSAECQSQPNIKLLNLNLIFNFINYIKLF